MTKKKRETKWDEFDDRDRRLSNPDQYPAEEFIGIPGTGEFPEWQPPQHQSINKEDPRR